MSVLLWCHELKCKKKNAVIFKNVLKCIYLSIFVVFGFLSVHGPLGLCTECPLDDLTQLLVKDAGWSADYANSSHLCPTDRQQS